MKRLVFGAALALGLAGCAPPAPTPAQIAASDDATCRSYGLEYGTDQYATCRENIGQQRAQASAQQRAMIANYLLSHP
jgi:hypothetical protein